MVTAAHCLDGLSALQYDVMAGQHNIHLPDPHQEVRLVSKGIMHPNYTWDDKEFDIGLIKLLTPLKFTDYIQPIPLATTRDPPAGALCQATGWGVTSEDGLFLASNLQEVTLPLVSDLTCYQTFGYLMRDNMICAGEAHAPTSSGAALIEHVINVETCGAKPSVGTRMSQSQQGHVDVWLRRVSFQARSIARNSLSASSAVYCKIASRLSFPDLSSKRHLLLHTAVVQLPAGDPLHRLWLHDQEGEE